MSPITPVQNQIQGQARPTMPSVQDLEQVLISGDLAPLTAEQRVSYYNKVCETVGLNPLTKPFDYIKLNGKLVLYANKGCAEQLRGIYGISVHKIEKSKLDDLYVVTAYARNADGRDDSSIGAVSTKSLHGEELANAMMKAETKAKRRVTLSICGLNMLDDSEKDDVNAEDRAGAIDVTTPKTETSAPLAQPAPPVIRTKAVVGAELLEQTEKMNLTQHELAAWMEEHIKKPYKQATLQEMEDFLGYLKFEAGKNGVKNEQG